MGLGTRAGWKWCDEGIREPHLCLPCLLLPSAILPYPFLPTQLMAPGETGCTERIRGSGRGFSPLRL